MPRAPGIGHLLVGQPDVAERMMRGLALKGTLPQYIDGDYDPMVVVEDLTAEEFGWCRRFIPWQAAIGQAAGGAGVFSLCVLGPKASQGRTALAVVDEIVISNLNAGAVQYRYGIIPTSASGSAGAISGVAPVDDRTLNNVPAGQNGLFAVGGGQNAVDPITLSPANAGLCVLLPNTSIILNQKWVLSGAVNTGGNQQYLAIWTTVANLSVNVGFRWRERALMATEA